MQHPRFIRAGVLLPLVFFFFCNALKAQEKLLPNAYAHNDYKHKHPLHDAVERGFGYVEADIYLRKGRLIVSHGPPLFGRRRTLEDLYLKPLFDSLAKGSESVLTTDGPITLVIDMKTRGKTYETLLSLLQKYQSILTSCKNGQVKTGQVTVVLSGKRPSGICCNENHFVFFDSDFRKAGNEPNPAGLYTLSSCKYSSFLNWRGEGAMPQEQKNKLCAFVKKAHELGRKVRLWASPENKAVWKELLGCGVDLINTDKLDKLRQFLLSREAALINEDYLVQNEATTIFSSL